MARPKLASNASGINKTYNKQQIKPMARECAQISINTVTGKAEMFSGNGITPWHGLGTVVEGLLTASEAIQAANLDWTVKGMPVTVNEKVLPFPSDETSDKCYQGIVRSDTGDCLGIVKGRYETIQNKDCFDFLDTLVGEGHVKYETAGALRGGRVIWLLAKYDGNLQINGDDHNQYLLLISSHDGSYALQVMWTTVRVVCNNTFNAALRSASNKVSIRHTSTWQGKAQEARRILNLTENYFGAMKAALEGLNEKQVTSDAASAFVNLLFPADDETKVPTRTRNIRDDIMRRYCTPETGTFGQSRWDLLNAVTDYADHAQVLRGENSSRLESSMLGAGAKLKQQAYEYLTDETMMAKLMAIKPYVPQATATATTVTSDDFATLLSR